MEATEILRFFAALVFVLALIGGTAWLMRRFGFMPRGIRKRGAGRRLEIIESLTLDVRNRAVLIRRDETEHLIILGPQNATIVENNISKSSINNNKINDTDNS